MNTPTEHVEGLNSLTRATVIPARKPDPEWFVRVRPGEEWQTTTTTVDIWGRGLYFVHNDVAVGLPEAEFTQLFTTINHQGVVFLWPVSVTALMGRPGRRRTWLPKWPPEALAELPPLDPSELGRQSSVKDPRSRALKLAISERRAVWTAEQKWVWVSQSRELGYAASDYSTVSGWVSRIPGMTPPPPIPELAWPGLSFQELLDITFKDRCIYSLDDPAVEEVLFQAYGDPRYRPKPPPWPPSGFR